MIEGHVVKGESLKDDASARRALAAAAKLECVRFERFRYENQTKYWTAKLVLFQGLDEDPDGPPDGYVQDTGVVVGGVNVYPNSAQDTFIGGHIVCEATRVKCSAQLQRDDGHEETFHHADKVAPAGYFFCAAVFGIAPGLGLNGNDIPTVYLEFVDVHYNKHVVPLKRILRKK